MTTMKQVLILLVLASLTFACKKKSEDPTIFEGKVVYADDNSPAAGVTLFVSYILKSTPLTGANPGDTKKIEIGEDGKFKVEFPYNSEFRTFLTSISRLKNDGSVIYFTQGDGMDCSPNDCSDFKPHQNYSNLIIKIPRP